MELVRAHYEDFGPTLVREKLLERHGLKLCVETVRKVLKTTGRPSLKSRRKRIGRSP